MKNLAFLVVLSLILGCASQVKKPRRVLSTPPVPKLSPPPSPEKIRRRLASIPPPADRPSLTGVETGETIQGTNSTWWFQVRWNARPRSPYSIQVSYDLKTWETVGSSTNLDYSTITFRDMSSGTNQHKFYRVEFFTDPTPPSTGGLLSR
jgi:hypothetical protein